MFSDSFADVLFLVGSERIHAHKAILASKCEYFAAMFQSGMKESRDKVIEIKECSGAFKLLLEYIYTDELKAKTELDSLKALQLSELYLLKDLKKLIEDDIKSKLTFENVLEIMNSALDMKLCNVCQSCYELLYSKFDSFIEGKEINLKIMTFDAWEYILEKRPYPSNVFLFVYQRPIPEIKVFSALLDWTQEINNDLKDERVQSLFSKIRLDSICPNDLIGKVRRSNVYDVNMLMDKVEEVMIDNNTLRDPCHPPRIRVPGPSS